MERHNRREKLLRRALLSPLLAAACLLSAVPALASDGVGTDCIVKYKESAAWLAEDDSVPFDVVSKAEALYLDRAGLLEWYEPDGEAELLGDALSPWYEDDKWDLALVQADAAFESGHLGQGVRVGVLDSGVNPRALLADCLLPGSNCMEDADPDDTADNYGHGTQVAGLIAGSGEDGYTGAAPGAEIVPLKITDGKAIMVSAVCRGIYSAIDDYGCQVLNLSLGVTSDYNVLREAVAYAEEQGVLIVSAVGNNGNAGIYYPAAYDTVIGIGSVDRTGSVYYRSNRNDTVFLTAPGVNVKTAGHLGGYVTASGTSFAVPYVTAAAAVLLSIDDSLAPAELRQILADTATDKGKVGWDEDYGYGILNLSGCVAALTGEGETSDTPCAFTSASTLRNDTGADIEATYLLAEYDENGKCLGVKLWPLTLPAGGSVTLQPPEEDTFYAQLVYETATMIPLAEARRSPSE
ncbi:MAG: S8 family serine peptidase [Oscillospiraceae bacterium]|nr:S8 family serine peptidase [Oscillospiraceae bacterium]